MDSGFHAVDSGFSGTGFQSLTVELGFCIAIFRRVADSLSCIPDFKGQDSGFYEQILPDSGFHKQKFLGFRNPESLTWGEKADLATEQERQLTTARAHQTTGLTNGKGVKWAPKVMFSPFRALSRRQLTFASCC